MKVFALALIAALPLFGASALAAGTHALALAPVAHRLGFHYAYLGGSDEVSLAGHGVAVVVRPGVPYFTVGDRVEPVAGDAPRYQDGDLFISPQFAGQLAAIAHAAAKSDSSTRARAVAENPAHINTAPPDALPHNVTLVKVGAVLGTDDVEVSGEATPGSLVAIVLKSIAAPELPTIFLNRSFAVAGKDGAFSIDIATAPEYFTGSTFIAEAAGIDDAKPMTARYTPPGK